MTTIYEQNNVPDPNVAAMQSAQSNPAFQSGGAETGPIQPGQNLGANTVAVVQPGQNITPPSPSKVQVQPGNTNTSTPQTSNYVVQKGDTLSQIAQNNNVSLQDLMKSNPNVTDPNKISTGQQLNLSNQSQDPGAKYKTALNNMSGTAPSNLGDAMDKLNGMLPSDNAGQTDEGAQQTQKITNTLENDPNFQQLLKDQQDYLSTVNQQKSFTQQYQDLSSQLGLPALNTQLINMKSVMDGTEQDIRNEITKAGGFATESQVQAMTSARNKLMVQNYNQLLATRDNAQSQLSTMIGLAEKDRASASSLASEKLNFDKQVIDYQQKMNDNAKSAYQKIIDTPGYGYKALYASTGGDAHTTSLIENSLGLPPGSLAQLASVPPELKTQVVKLDNGASVLINSQTGQTIKSLGGAASTGGGNGSNNPYVQAHVASILNGNETMAQVPANLRNAVVLAMNNAPKDQYSPLAASRFATASNRIVSNFIKLPQYELTANGLPYLQRIDAAMKTPGSISDQDLLDSLVKLNTAGNAVTEAQVKLITGGKSFADMANSVTNKFKNGGVLSDNQRKQIQDIASAVYANYKKGYAPVYAQVTKQLTDAGIPKAFWTVPDLNNLSAQAQGDTSNTHNESTLPPNIDSALSANAVTDTNAKTVTIPRSVWSTFGTSMDSVLSAIQGKGYQLLIK